MPRKRDAYTRSRAKRTRPQTPAPTEGFLIHDIARLTAVPVRTLRDYVRRGLLRHTELRGTSPAIRAAKCCASSARYALKRKRKQPGARSRLDALAEPQLTAWLAEQALPPAVVAELGIGRSVTQSALGGTLSLSGVL